jgi:hypothetical protein
VTATLKPGLDPRDVPTSLAGSDGVAVDARAVRVPATREVVWRVENRSRDDGALVARSYDVDYRFPLRSAPRARALGSARSNSIMDGLLHPGLPALPPNGAFESVRVSYPDASYRIAGVRTGWLTIFLLGTFLGAAIPAWILRMQL